jgi:hypothetical protein
LLAAMAALAIAMFLNDSGVAIPAIGLAIGAPWAVAALIPGHTGPGRLGGQGG